MILGSNELALTEAEVAAMPAGELKARMQAVRYKMYAAGADNVIDSIEELPMVIEVLNK